MFNYVLDFIISMKNNRDEKKKKGLEWIRRKKKKIVAIAYDAKIEKRKKEWDEET